MNTEGDKISSRTFYSISLHKSNFNQILLWLILVKKLDNLIR